ncbi:MAG: hypothetical protein ACYS9C_16840 [Planctomycetota bacterium]|jgi:hypothetical protein
MNQWSSHPTSNYDWDKIERGRIDGYTQVEEAVRYRYWDQCYSYPV